ncbi:MAG: hypothetical protein R3E66_04430 [bacterium]
MMVFRWVYSADCLKFARCSVMCALMAVCCGCSSNDDSSSDISDGTSACQTALLPMATSVAVVDLPDGRPINAEVFEDGSGYVLLANQLVFGAGRTPVLRYESSDGVNFTTSTEIAGSDHWRSPSIVNHKGTWFMFYRSSLWDSGLDYDTIGLATSVDGLQWTDQGVVVDGVGDAIPGATTLTEPRVWHDGLRFHLYVTAWNEVTIEDMTGAVWSIAHAVSEDGMAFSQVDVPFAARPCEAASPTTSGFEQFAVGGIVRSVCGTELCRDRLALVVRHLECASGTKPSSFRLEVVMSDDGTTFSPPRASLPDQQYSTAALADDDTLWLYRDEETAHNDGQIILTPVELTTSLCDTP